MKAIDVWRVEYAKPVVGSYAPQVIVCRSYETAEENAQLVRNDGCACVRITGPHKHMMPD